MKCLACGSEFSRTFEAREMMFGRREVFRYGECGGSGMLQIERVPENLSSYYPRDYYSLRLPPARRTALPAIRKAWARWLVKPGSGMAERMARALYRKSPFFTWARLTGSGLDAAILEVGCGSGGLRRRM